MMNQRIKDALKVTDDEWAVLQPLLQKVEDKQRAAMETRGFGGFGRGGYGNRGPRGGDAGGATAGNAATPPPRPGAEQVQALRTALESDSTPSDDIKAKLTALRDQRKKAEADLAAARQDLQKVLTLRQEATLVSMGILE